MNLNMVGGPHCGHDTMVSENVEEGQKVVVHNSDYFYHKPEGKIGRLIFYPALKEI